MSIKLQAGKSYRTAAGENTGPLEANSDGFRSPNVKMVCGGNRARYGQIYNADGSVFNRRAGEERDHIIAEWVEPDDGWTLSDVPEWDTSTHDVKFECIDGIHKVWLRPRKPVVETVTLYWAGGCAGPEQTNLDTHTITLTKIDGVWQRDAVLEEIK